MRSLFFFCLGLVLALSGQAQERVRNVRIRVADSSQLEIQYDLINARPGDSIYVDVRSRLRGALRILPEFVRGDIGKRVVAGTGRRIVWNALANGYSLNEEVRATVFVKAGPPVTLQSSRPAPPEPTAQPRTDSPTPDVVVEKPRPTDPVAVQPAPTETRPAPATSTVGIPAPVAQPTTRPSETVTKPTAQPGAAQPTATQPTVAKARPASAPLPAPVKPDTVVSRKKRYAGPAWALLSAIAPGIGNIFVQTPKPRIGFRPLLAVGCYGLLYYGFQERQKSRDVYAIYDQQKNAETGDPYYKTANTYYHHYYLATRGALVVAAADVILTFFKGMRNVQATKKTSLQSVTLRPGLQAGQPTAVLHYSF